ncbi:hypothetical protein D3C76_1093440 [compost metagenome]
MLEGRVQRQHHVPVLGRVQVQPEDRREVQGGGPAPGMLADEQGQGGLALLPARQFRVVIEARPGVLIALWQSNPELGGVQVGVARQGLLGVGDTAPGRHQIDLARADHLLAAQAVPVEDLPRQHPGEGLQGDMGMGPHVQPGGAGGEAGRPYVIEKAPGPYGAPLLDREGAGHRDAAHVGEAGGNTLPLLRHVVLLAMG